MFPDESVPSPGTFIVYELERRGWSQREFAEIIGRPFQLVNEIIKGKRAITTDTAVAIGAAFGDGPEVWLQREAAYQVSKAEVDTASVQKRAQLYRFAPVKDMEKRGWIQPSKNTDELESELKRFFGVSSIDDDPPLSAAMRKTDVEEPLTSGQRAWCFRVLQIAKSIAVPTYRQSELDACKAELRKLAAYPQEAHKVSQVLSSFGIRFVVVEHLPGTKVDGVAMWLDNQSPVIGMSLRYDRIDSFWFTLCHEISHIAHCDDAPLDADLTDRMAGITIVRAPIERRANAESSAVLVPTKELESFVMRVGPLYAKEKIIRFAHRIKMHPGIIVGQLQQRDEIGYSANREMLSKIRQFVISSAVTDGWGHVLDPRSVE